MPIANVCLSPPTYNSDKDSPPFSLFYDNMLSFVAYNKGGNAIVALVNKVLGREDHSFSAHSAAALDDAISLSSDELANISTTSLGLVEQEQDGDGEPILVPRVVESYQDLTLEEQTLDQDLHTVLLHSISGKHRVCITKTQMRSFIQAFVLLTRELGASNIKRKTDLISQLHKLSFHSDTAKFKTEASVAINALYAK